MSTGKDDFKILSYTLFCLATSIRSSIYRQHFEFYTVNIRDSKLEMI